MRVGTSTDWKAQNDWMISNAKASWDANRMSCDDFLAYKKKLNLELRKRKLEEEEEAALRGSRWCALRATTTLS